MITVGRLTPAAKRNGGRLGAHQKQRRPLTNVDAIAVPTERIALCCADGFKRFESGDGESAQRIHATREHRVANTHPDQTRRAGQRLCTRRAGARMNIRWPADAKSDGQRSRGRTQFLLAIMKFLRQRTPNGISAHCRFALCYSRSASPNHNTDSVGAIVFNGRIHRRSYLSQRSQCKLIVAATITQRQLIHRGQRQRGVDLTERHRVSG